MGVLPTATTEPFTGKLKFLMEKFTSKYIQNGGVTKSPHLTAATYCAFSSQNTDDKRLDHVCCNKGGTLNVLTWIEPFELTLGGRRK